jgi:choline kinase
MKAIILAAGIGSRISPLTKNKPKPLLEVCGKTIFERMVNNILSCGINEIVVITGYLENQIINFSKLKFPTVKFTFIRNDNYLDTNTAYSLLLAKKAVSSVDFLKFDGDVVFEFEIIKRLVNHSSRTCLCIDKNIDVAEEEVKVITDSKGNVIEVGKSLDPKKANGESIGIEKISNDAAKILFDDLERLMNDPQNYKKYYDDSYTTLVKKGVGMKAIDITGLKWIEIDTHADYEKAQKLFQ